LSKGITAQDKTLKKKVLIGAKIKIIKLEELGIKVSLLKNLIASAMACNKPKSPTTLGPLRRCILAKTLRSNIVKKATANNKGKITGKNFNQSISNKKIIKNKKNLIINKKIDIIKILINY
jgi:hypothetical protein